MINNFKRNRAVLSLIVLVSLTLGCTKTVEMQEPERRTPAEITLTPVDLFKGDAAKFQPFLGAMSGAFTLSYKGNKPNAVLDIDIWKNGKKTASAGSVGDMFFSKESHEVEVIIAVEKVSFEGQGEQNMIKVATIHDSGTSLATFFAPWDDKWTGRGTMNISQPQTFYAEKPVHVWGMQGTSTNSMYTLDLSEDSLSRVEGALIFTLRFVE